jgi:predicted nuclease of restriction endonuclease-like (RecB) superfamily
MDNRFTDIIQLIKQSRTNAIKAVNAQLINLYWNIGEYISKKIEQSEWGDSVVTELASFIQTHEPDIKGFSDKNIWRMKQFYETYKDYPKLSPLVSESNDDLTKTFKDSYVFEFLNLPDPHSEGDLQLGLVRQMKNFILELGKDFLLIEEEYKLQVGNSDFYVDLLFYHRGLQCLVAFELKADKFKPEHLGQLRFVSSATNM